MGSGTTAPKLTRGVPLSPESKPGSFAITVIFLEPRIRSPTARATNRNDRRENKNGELVPEDLISRRHSGDRRFAKCSSGGLGPTPGNSRAVISLPMLAFLLPTHTNQF